MQLKEQSQRFIPYRKTDIIEMCCDDDHFSNTETKHFREVCELLSSIYHFRFHKSLETLKDCYAPGNPDADTKFVYRKSKKQRKALEETLTNELQTLLNTANFEVITKEDLQNAMAEESLFQIKLNVDFDDFEQVLFFRRGETVREETLIRWLGLSKKKISFLNYDRVVVYVKIKEQAYFDQHKKKDLFFTPGSTIIKLFQNIPSSDLEMLFPNTEIKMKPIDKLMIGVPAAVGGIIMLATKLGTTLILIGGLLAFWLGMHDEPVVLDQTALIAVAAGFGTLGAYLWKQFSNFKNRKIRFMKALTDNLYFKNLDNNTGVFHRLIDAAEEEEFKESILAYYFLLRSGQSLEAKELDQAIEDWFEINYHHSLDFEIEDALNKLKELKLVKQSGDNISAVPLQQAKIILDQRWDNYFDFNQTETK